MAWGLPTGLFSFDRVVGHGTLGLKESPKSKNSVESYTHRYSVPGNVDSSLDCVWRECSFIEQRLSEQPVMLFARFQKKCMVTDLSVLLPSSDNDDTSTVSPEPR
jgi:hypothetical protein